MKHILFGIVFILILTSCRTSFNYAQMNSDNPYIEKDENGNFISDSDSLNITYSFYGENAPVSVAVKNKMCRPLYIDWNESVFRFGDNEENIFSPAAYMGEEEKTELIEPYSEKKRVLLEISNLDLRKIDTFFVEPQPIKKSNGKTVKLKRLYFDEESTPLYINSTIALRIGGKDEKPLYYEQDFYMSSIIKNCAFKPEKLDGYANGRGDCFYIVNYKDDTFGTVLFILGVIGSLNNDSEE